MVRIERWKAYLITFICLVGIVYALPNALSQRTLEHLPGWAPTQKINLGLDLQGGSYLLLQVDVASVLAEHMNNITDTVRRGLRTRSLTYNNFVAEGTTINFGIGSDADYAKVREFLNDEYPSEVDVARGDAENSVVVSLKPTFIKERQDYALSQSIEIVRRRVDETGTKEPLIQRQGTDRILLQLPGVEDPQRIKKLLGKTAKLTFHLVDMERTFSATPEKRVPVSLIKVPPSKNESRGSLENYVLQRRSLLTGDMLVDASPSFDQNNRPVVSFRLDNVGAKRFADVTTKNVDKLFAIVLDNEVISAPNINEPIIGGSAQISGSFTLEEVKDLSLLLRAGALPAPLHILEERTVGPGLGADSIAAGETASMLGLSLVIGFLILAYGFFGILSVIALIINITLIIASLSILQATLTLPGIAGIVLTIGMAVDANVLIFERIREELNNGRPPISAIDSGYSQAYSSIVDANVTTLIAAVLLYIFGTGPIRGFAVTLTIGIITSFFSAIMITRLMVTTWLWKRKPQSLRF